uniref:Atp synthase subunit mitochondrial n=1 Tax=Triatoma infestans TaxID=30076 RepID=A0A161THZ4_TRIIF
MTKVELTPPSPGELSGIGNGIKNIITSAKTGKWKQLTVREAWLNLLVATEVTCWFYIGECIGKRNVIGYKIEV